MISELQKKRANQKNTFHLLKGCKALIRCSILSWGRYCWSNTPPDFCWSSFLEGLWLLVFIYLFVFSFEFPFHVASFMCLVCVFYFFHCVLKAILLSSPSCTPVVAGDWPVALCASFPGASLLYRVCSLKTPVIILCFYSQRPLLECRLCYNHTEQLTNKTL